MKILSLCISIVYLSLNFSCKKFLDEKSNQSLAKPSSLSDLQAVLDNPNLNKTGAGLNFGTDEYYMTYADYLSRDQLTRDAYIWAAQTQNNDDWEILYRSIFTANTVLYEIENIPSVGQEQLKNQIMGAALFTRAFNFFQLSQIYALPYVSSIGGTELGIPLRVTSNFNIPTTRPTLEQTYNQIINDLTEATELLPREILPTNALTKTRPTRLAAFALLSRVYITKGDYSSSKKYCDSVLNNFNQLINYNNLSAASRYPIPILNSETIYYAETDVPINANHVRAKVDSTLYRSFDVNDLRKTIFFFDNGNGTYAFKGNYSGGLPLFNGLAIDEIYLTRAECKVRMGDIAAAMNDLNTLVFTRWKNTAPYIQITATTETDGLLKIVNERKKQLIYRGTRWTDLRRLNNDSRFAISLTRMLNGQLYMLNPNDLRYAYLIPQVVIELTGIQQNKR